jgi:CheY-like chemotaxis protein
MSVKFKFLLVDDSLLDLFIHKKLIAISNMAESITTLNSGEEALEYLKANEQILEESIMLLDLQMPGMNGFEFIDAFDKLSNLIKSRIKIYILSSTVDYADISKAKSSPYVEDMLSKPVDVKVLMEKLGVKDE